MPYTKADYINNTEDYNKYYDEIEICERSASSHPKAAITIRNRYMIEKSDVCVFYIRQNRGGAFDAFKYAKKLGKNIFLLD